MYPEEDITHNQRRQERLIDLYLNMPDKGGGDTPLHLAAKFGNTAMVEFLTIQPQLNTSLRNKFGERAEDIVCSRVKTVGDGAPSAERIRELIAGLQYIPLYKELGYMGPSILGRPCKLTN